MLLPFPCQNRVSEARSRDRSTRVAQTWGMGPSDRADGPMSWLSIRFKNRVEILGATLVPVPGYISLGGYTVACSLGWLGRALNLMPQVPPTTTISSTNFETVFTAGTLKAYKQTKMDIGSHPPAIQLQSYGSPNAILAVLRAHVQTLDSLISLKVLTKPGQSGWIQP